MEKIKIILLLVVFCILPVSSIASMSITSGLASIDYTLKVEDDAVVWADDRMGNYDIYGYSLTTGEEFVVYQGPGDQTIKCVELGWLFFFVDESLYMFEIATKETSIFEKTFTYDELRTVRIDGNFILWREYYDLFVHDLRSSTTSLISGLVSTSSYSAQGEEYIVYAKGGPGVTPSPTLRKYNVETGADALINGTWYGRRVSYRIFNDAIAYTSDPTEINWTVKHDYLGTLNLPEKPLWSNQNDVAYLLDGTIFYIEGTHPNIELGESVYIYYLEETHISYRADNQEMLLDLSNDSVWLLAHDDSPFRFISAMNVGPNLFLYSIQVDTNVKLLILDTTTGKQRILAENVINYEVNDGIVIYQVLSELEYDELKCMTLWEVGFAGSEKIDLGQIKEGNTSKDATSEDLTLLGYNDTVDTWYNFTAPADGDYILTTFGSDFDTTLAVFDDDYTEMEFNDNYNSKQSKLTLRAKAGVKYFIRIAGYNGQTGNYRLSIINDGPDPLLSDINSDGSVNAQDFVVLASEWLESNN